MSSVIPFPYFRDYTWGTPVIPNLYWNVYDYEERIKKLCEEFDKFVEYVDSFADQYNITKQDVEELQEQFQKFMESGFEDYYKEQIVKWIDEHLSFIYENTMKQVYFGLTDDGYFCAYVPDKWSDITFDTGQVYGRSDYGRLILRYDVEGQGVIDNTYSYNVANSKTQQIQADLELLMKQLFTDLDEVVS